MERIRDDILARRVSGVNLAPGSLADQLGSGTTLFVFLRYFGCIFCREALSDLREVAESRDDYPDVLFFTQAGATESRAFLRIYWPQARAIADPEHAFYDAFSIGRASFLEALGPRVLVARSRARGKGHRNGERSGDIWRLPGVLAVEDGQILWRYEPSHAADHPEFEAVPAVLRAARAAAPG